MENITIKINGVEVSAPAGSTILEAARLAHIDIPTLCYLKEINEIGACRMCIVEVKGARSLVASCVYPINPGMEVWTNTPKVIESRKSSAFRRADQPSGCGREGRIKACAEGVPRNGFVNLQ